MSGLIPVSAEQCEALMRELHLSSSQGCVAVGSDRIHVYIWRKTKKPPMTKWLGYLIEFHIGGGEPRPLVAAP